MRVLISTTVLFAALAVMVPQPAEAVVFGFSCVTNNSAADCLSGEAQFSVGVTEGASGRIKFDFRNAGPEQSSIARIYFDGAPLLKSIYKITDYAGTDFEKNAKPLNMPGWNEVNPVFLADFSAQAIDPKAWQGINPDERLKITVTTLAGLDFEEAIHAMSSGAIRVGIHAIGWTDGESEGFVTSGEPVGQVPEPPAIMLFGGVLLAAAHVLRRRWLHHPAGK